MQSATKIIQQALLLTSFFTFLNCKSEVEKHQFFGLNSKNTISKTLSLLDYDELMQNKAEINSAKFKSKYNNLIEDADKALKEGPFSVVHKTQVPPSGDKRDYISYGPYWWPDPTKGDGLPWIRRDGEVNPLTRKDNTDYEVKNKMFNNTSTLTWAYFFSDDKKYANKLKELLKVWFLDKETKMNPNLDFAQGIPGKNNGRGIGIIEFTGISNIINAIEILELKGELTDENSSQYRKWFGDYLNWLQTSENGVFERDTKNNHGTWYDTQIVSILIFLNRKEEAKEVLEIAKTKRIASQIEPDGRQPHELERTKSLSYSTMNLRGMTQLAYLGTKVGVDLWNYKVKDGSSIIQAYEFLKPYAKGEKEWDYEQINSLSSAKKSLKNLFTATGCTFDIPEYRQIGGVQNSLFYFCKN